MHQAIKASLSVLSFVAACSTLGYLAHMSKASTTPVDVAPSVVTIPEVTITGEARVIDLPEMVIEASAGKVTHKVKSRSHRSSTTGRTFTHTLTQGGRPDAPTVRVTGY